CVSQLKAMSGANILYKLDCKLQRMPQIILISFINYKLSIIPLKPLRFLCHCAHFYKPQALHLFTLTELEHNLKQLGVHSIQSELVLEISQNIQAHIATFLVTF